MLLRWMTELPARTSRLTMSISISPSLMVGTIGRWIPDARREMTIERASSSSGENGIVRMSSTPRSNARSLVGRSPRRVRPRTGMSLRGQRVRRAEPQEQIGAVVVIHVDDGHVRPPLGEDRLGLGQVAGGADDEEAVVERQLDEVDDEGALVEDQGAARLGLPCVRLSLRHGSSPRFGSAPVFSYSTRITTRN